MSKRVFLTREFDRHLVSEKCKDIVRTFIMTLSIVGSNGFIALLYADNVSKRRLITRAFVVTKHQILSTRTSCL